METPFLYLSTRNSHRAVFQPFQAPPFQFRILKLASSFRIDPIGIEEHTKASIYRHGCSGENASREGGNMDDERGGKEESHVVDSQSRSPPYFFFFISALAARCVLSRWKNNQPPSPRRKPSKQWALVIPSPGYIQSVFETGHERAAYALRISRRLPTFHPFGRKATEAPAFRTIIP